MTDARAPQGATDDWLREDMRRRGFVVALLALFTAGAAVSMRAVTAVHMQSEFLDPIGPVHAGERLYRICTYENPFASSAARMPAAIISIAGQPL